MVECFAAVHVNRQAHTGCKCIVEFHIRRYAECGAGVDGDVGVDAQAKHHTFAVEAHKWRDAGYALAVVLLGCFLEGVEVDVWRIGVRGIVETHLRTGCGVVVHLIFSAKIHKEVGFFQAFIVDECRFLESAVTHTGFNLIVEFAVGFAAIPSAGHAKLAERLVAELVGAIVAHIIAAWHNACIAIVVECVEVGAQVDSHSALVEAAGEVGSDGVVVEFLLELIIRSSRRRVFACPSAVVLQP